MVAAVAVRPAGRRVADRRQGRLVLLTLHGIELPGGAEGEQAVDAALEQVDGQGAEGVRADGAAFIEGRDDGRNHAVGLIHGTPPSGRRAAAWFWGPV